MFSFKSSHNLFLLIAAMALLSTSHARTFSFQNDCAQTVWVGALGNDGKEAPNNGGWQLDQGQGNSVDTADDWGGRFWGRTGCTFDQNGNGNCETGDCGGVLACGGKGGAPQVSLAEFLLKGDAGKDYFDISLVDAFNLPMSITPDNGCPGPTCNADINPTCPPDYQIKGADGTTVVGCLSVCGKENTDQACCRNDFNHVESCPVPDHIDIFESPCPQAYSWAFDDKSSTFTCEGANYLITFCPTQIAGLSTGSVSTEGKRKRMRCK